MTGRDTDIGQIVGGKMHCPVQNNRTKRGLSVDSCFLLLTSNEHRFLTPNRYHHLRCTGWHTNLSLFCGFSTTNWFAVHPGITAIKPRATAKWSEDGGWSESLDFPSRGSRDDCTRTDECQTRWSPKANFSEYVDFKATIIWRGKKKSSQSH